MQDKIKWWDNFDTELYQKIKEARLNNMVNNSKPFIKRAENKIIFLIGLN